MKIGVIGQKGIPSRAGGVEIHVEELASRLVSLGNDVTVYCRKSYCDEIKDVHRGIKLKYIPSLNTKHLDAITYTMLASIDAIRSDYDVVHYHALGPSLLSFIPRVFGKKVVCTVHGLDWKREKWGAVAKKTLKLGELCTAKFPNKTISVSETIKAYYNETYKNNTVYIPNGVEEGSYVPAEEIVEKYGVKQGEYILFLARLVPEKGLHYLIEAYNKIKTDKKLVIAGGSSHTDDYVNEIKEMVKDNPNIIMTGFISGKPLKELFSNAYLYVLPSEIEGLPISLLEAMSYGQCCLVSNIEENIDVIKSYGYSFESKNVDSLKQVLEQLLENEEMVQKVRNNVKEYVKEEYDWDRVASKTEKVYQSLFYNTDDLILDGEW